MYNVHVLSGRTATPSSIQKTFTEEGFVTTKLACDCYHLNNYYIHVRTCIYMYINTYTCIYMYMYMYNNYKCTFSYCCKTHFVCSQTVSNTIERWLSTGSIEDRPRTGCPKVYSEDHVVFIDECMMKNDELTTRDLADKVKITFSDVKMSDATIVRIRKEQNISTLLPVN